jgi:hypothetical protein
VLPPTAWDAGSADWTASLDQGQAKLAATLNFFGSNEGIITKRDSPPSSEAASESGDDSDDGNLAVEHPHYDIQLGEEVALLPRRVQAKLEDQAAYIVQLEEENLNLREVGTRSCHSTWSKTIAFIDSRRWPANFFSKKGCVFHGLFQGLVRCQRKQGTPLPRAFGSARSDMVSP